MATFEELTKSMTETEILNLYRNWYYREPNTTERGIVAWAINKILPTYCNRKQIQEHAVLKFAERLKAEAYQSITTSSSFTPMKFEDVVDDIVKEMLEELNNADN